MQQVLETTLVGETAAPAPSKPRRAQKRRTAERIIQARELLDAVQNDAETTALLEPFGYRAAEFAQGAALQNAAQAAFNARQRATGTRQQASHSYHRAYRDASKTYIAFRQIARGLFPATSARLALGLTGPMQREVEPFLAQAQATYTTALETPGYLAVLVANGYPETELAGNLTQLQTLITAINASGAATAAAIHATAERETALAALEAWLSRFRAVARYALRERSDLAMRVGL